MKNVSLYEQLGILIPGAMLLFGIVLLAPDLKQILVGEGVTVGGLGLYLVLSYPLGHLVASVGNLLERAVWPRGMPSLWIVGRGDKIMGPERIVALKGKLAARLAIDFDAVSTDRVTWGPAFAQLYRDVLTSGRAGRVETFNGTYGLTRGLACASFMLAAGCIFERPADWPWPAGALAFVGLVFIQRMRRFGMHFTREVLFNFILLPDDRFAMGGIQSSKNAAAMEDRSD